MKTIPNTEETIQKVFFFAKGTKKSEALLELMKKKKIPVSRIFNEDLEPSVVFGPNSWKGEIQIKDFINLWNNSKLFFNRLEDGIIS